MVFGALLLSSNSHQPPRPKLESVNPVGDEQDSRRSTAVQCGWCISCDPGNQSQDVGFRDRFGLGFEVSGRWEMGTVQECGPTRGHWRVAVAVAVEVAVRLTTKGTKIRYLGKLVRTWKGGAPCDTHTNKNKHSNLGLWGRAEVH